MSRYHFHTKINDKKVEIAYGFDRPLSEYFIQVWDLESQEEDDGLILNESSVLTNKSNSEMYHLFKKYNVPDEHCLHLLLDMPF